MGSETLFSKSLSPLNPRTFSLPLQASGEFQKALKIFFFFYMKGPGTRYCLTNWQVNLWCKAAENTCPLTSVWESYYNIEDRIVYRNTDIYYVVAYHILVSKYIYTQPCMNIYLYFMYRPMSIRHQQISVHI